MGTAPSPRVDVYEHPDPARWAAFRRVYENYLVIEDIYPSLAARFHTAGVRRFVELGGGRGPISALLASSLPRGGMACVVDIDRQMVSEAPAPAVRGDLAALPLAHGSVDGAAAVNCLYFLPDPRLALREAKRVLRRGGMFVASAPSRWNDPELRAIDPRWGVPSPFDAEDAPRLVGEVFGDVEVQPWRLVAYMLPDRAAVADYLHAFNIPAWEERAVELPVPLSVTKVGAQVWAHA
jgi:SAM-dependent methyltransferase